jgi:hypothetical protein
MTPDGYNPGAAEDPTTNPDLAVDEEAVDEEPVDGSEGHVPFAT